MNRAATTTRLVHELMQDFARDTGLDPLTPHKKRYLWTDAFAVCNYLGLFQLTHNRTYKDLALRLVDQVHYTLGRHRDDDNRAGWISGLSAREGEQHPTIGGLRIGKTLPERTSDELYDERAEWDRDGQYYHYLTKWMHALNRVSRVTGDPVYLTWAIELARAAHAGFTHRVPGSGEKRMHWKMSIDLTRPLVPSMGQHDPLDGFVTCYELRQSASGNLWQTDPPILVQEMAEMRSICRGIHFATDDPLGIGGLLSDASRISRLTPSGSGDSSSLLESLVSSALEGLDSFTGSGSPDLPARHRLAFRELGLTIGLAGVENLQAWMMNNPTLCEGTSALSRQIPALLEYLPLREKIEQFWLDAKNQKASPWTDHLEINRVMLATSLAPEAFLDV
jgi:hypothetical protein